MRSYRNAPESRGIWTANPTCAPRPNGVACAAGSASSAEQLLSPRRSAVCAACTCVSWQPHGRWDCHILCRGTSAAAHPSSVRVAPRRSLRSCAPVAWCHARSRRRWRCPTDHPVRRRSSCVWCRFFHGQWGFAQLCPPKTRLGHGAIGTLPIPMDAAEFFALGNQGRHDLGHDAVLVPALEPVMHGALGTKALRQFFPLATGSHAENDAVERQAPVRELATGGFLRPELVEDRTDTIP